MRRYSSAADAETDFFLAEAHDTRVAKASQRPIVEGRAERLCRVVNDANVLLARQLNDRPDIGGVTE